MYVPQHFAESDPAALHALMRARPLATWVTQDEGELLVNHLPFLLDAGRGEHGVLSAHVARANPVWRALAGQAGAAAAPSVVVFQGAQAYITPSWYAGKRENGKAVPTWNYAVVHAHGVARIVEDREWLLRHVGQLSDAHEAGEAVPWQLSDAPPEYVDSLLRAVVGIEIVITRLVGKWKVSQNRPAADKPGIVAGLRARRREFAGNGGAGRESPARPAVKSRWLAKPGAKRRNRLCCLSIRVEES